MGRYKGSGGGFPPNQYRRRRGGGLLSRLPILPLTMLLGGAFGAVYTLDLENVAPAPSFLASAPAPLKAPGNSEGKSSISANFRLCGWAPHRNCVMDGDTFYVGYEPVRMADIDTPETHPPRCAREAELGRRATERLQALLNSGPFTLHGFDDRDEDQYGRKLRIVRRNGNSLGGVLVAEGLARNWTGSRRSWCA